MKSYSILIEYRDGKKEERYVDDYSVRDGCLNLYVRFGVNAGLRCIPFDRIKEYKVNR